MCFFQDDLSNVKQHNRELRSELHQARISLETLMQQARDARGSEDERVSRLREELQECEAGLEKQLLDALVDGSAAKVPNSRWRADPNWRLLPF